MKRLILVFILIIGSFLTGCEFPTNPNQANQIKTLENPLITIDDNGFVYWDRIENACGYICLINGKKTETLNNFIRINYGETVSVMAVCENGQYKNSGWSNSVTYYDNRTYYTVKFFDLDNNLIYQVEVLENGTVEFNGQLPEISDEDYIYTFLDWSESLENITSNLYVFPVYEKTLIEKENRLDTPSVIDNGNGAVSWNKIEGATKYGYVVNDKEMEFTTNLFVFLEADDRIKVKAFGDECDSVWTNEIIVKTDFEQTDLMYNVKDLYNHNIYDVDAMVPTGEQSMIVIPVWFNDSKDYIDNTMKATIKDDLEDAFFGTEEETGWESVRSYYYEDSYGELELNGVVTDWYNCGRNAKNISEISVDQVVVDAVKWFKSNYDGDIKDFDTDGNGYLDSVCIIYGYPNCETINSSNDNLWAFVYWLQDVSKKNVSNPGVNSYLFASYDFMYEEAGDTRFCNIDTHTYIHEVGHLLGLDDYYDYSLTTNPAGGYSMQDYNVGGHDPYSKMLLDWVDPYVVNDSTTITIKPFESSGDVILLSPNYSGSVYDEYLLIELYTPTGLNKFDSEHAYLTDCPQGPSQAGIRIWHVDGRLAYVSDPDYEALSASKVTNKILDKYYFPANSNTYPARGYESLCTEIVSFRYYNVLQLIRNNQSSTYKTNADFSSYDMFMAGDVFDITMFSKQFYNSGKFNNGMNFTFIIEVQDVSLDGAVIKITKN